MIALWGKVIRPLVEAINGTRILEIGAEYGLSTKALSNYVRQVDGHLHCIDPAPGFDVAEFVAQHEGRLSFYEDMSLNAIPLIPEVDVAMVDGDHNWYTVYHELKAIEASHGHDPEKLPLIFVHDIGWPYGRRDLYYDPATVPEAFRQPYARRGMGPAKKELLPEGGLNADLCNAVIEGGERNGVLTGVEDYIKESNLELEFLNLPLYFGLGVIISKARIRSNPALATEVEKLHQLLQGEKLITIAEKLRMQLAVWVEKLERQRDESRAREQELERELARLREDRPASLDLTVIVVVYDMAREIPRTLQSLSRTYQENCEDLSYEVLVIDNGSPNPVDEKVITAAGPEFQYHRLENPPPSPAYALNYGAEHARGNTLCFMIDGAHMLTPGTFYKAMGARKALANAVVMVRYFYMGPGQQNETILQGYDKAREDELLREIDWPNDGYRLFEVGSAQVPKGFPVVAWFYKPLESNCLFMSARHFSDIGGADERFDNPGGGFLNLDLFKRACDSGDATPVMLIGEGSFHQLHGGTTTNIPLEVQGPLVETYKRQYREIRGEDMTGVDRELFYFGHMPTPASKIHRANHNKAGAKATNR